MASRKWVLKNIIQLPWSDEWLSPYFYIHQQPPHLEGETRPEESASLEAQRGTLPKVLPT